MTRAEPRAATRRDVLRWGASAAVIAGVSGVAGMTLAGCGETEARRDPRTLDGALLGQPLSKPAETFADTAGGAFDLVADTAGRLSMWFFGYTSCPDVCPVTLGVLAASLERLEGKAKAAQVCFVGVDTRRDTPDAIGTYLNGIDGDFIGLTASPEVIERTMAALNLPAPTFDPPDERGDYAVGHPSQVLAFTRDDLCHVVYPFGTRRQTWLRDLPLLADMSWTGAP